MTGGIVLSLIGVVVTRCSDFWISAGQFLEQLRNGTGSFPVWFPGGCSVATMYLCGWVPLGGTVLLVTVVFEVAGVYCVVESLVVLSELFWSVKVSEDWSQTTSGTAGSFGVLVVSGLSHTAPESRRGVSSLKFRLQLEHSHLRCFEQLFVGLDSDHSVLCSVEVVCSLRLLHSNLSLWKG